MSFGAGALVVGGVAWAVNGLLGLDAGAGTTGFYVTEAVWLVVHSLVLVGLVEFARTPAVRARRSGAAGARLAVAGRVVFLVAEVVAIVIGDDEVPLLPLAAVMTAVGMIVAGVAVAKAGGWRGPRRYAPLAMGLYPFVAMFPLLAITGERPDTALSGWGLMIAGLGLALAGAPRAERRERGVPARQVAARAR